MISYDNLARVSQPLPTRAATTSYSSDCPLLCNPKPTHSPRIQSTMTCQPTPLDVMLQKNTTLPQLPDGHRGGAANGSGREAKTCLACRKAKVCALLGWGWPHFWEWPHFETLLQVCVALQEHAIHTSDPKAKMSFCILPVATPPAPYTPCTNGHLTSSRALDPLVPTHPYHLLNFLAQLNSTPRIEHSNCSQVKCDMGLPCGRCARLDVVCEPTPPSRRGRPGEPLTKKRKVVANNAIRE